MTDPENDIIAETISEWLGKEGADIASLSDAIVNALDDAGFIIVEVGKPQVTFDEQGMTISNSGFAANDIVLPFAGFVKVPEGLQDKE